MLSKRKILVVEDDFILYEELVEFFEGKGFQVIGLPEAVPVDNYNDAVQLIKKFEPDLAVLDIEIKGPKDGIELGTFIRRHYEIPIVYLSAYDNFENIDRVRQSGSNPFVIKMGKPVNKQQLWASVQLALPRSEQVIKKKTIGSFFKVKEMNIVSEANRQRISPQHVDASIEIETYVKWEDIQYIESFNNKTAGSGNNNLLMHMHNHKKAFMLRGALGELELRLPAQFVRFDQSTIVNLNEITGRNKTGTVYFINNLTFKISDTYRKAALEKIDLFLGAGGNIPE